MANEATRGLQNALFYKWEYATSAARVAATGFASTDVGTVARQLSDNTFWVLTATTPTWVQLGGGGGGGGGNALTRGLYSGTRPSAPTSGDQYIVSDGWWDETWDGSAWQPRGPRFALINPLLRTWAWANQGTATIDTSRGGIILKAPGSSGNQLRIYEETISGNYTVTAGFLPQLAAVGTAPNMGLVVRDSSGGKAIEFAIMDNNGTPLIRIDQWNSASSWSGSIYSGGVLAAAGPGLHWLRIQDNGTNRLYSLSADGRTWTQVYSESRATWCTPDRRGIAVSPQTSGYDQSLVLLSWEVV